MPIALSAPLNLHRLVRPLTGEPASTQMSTIQDIGFAESAKPAWEGYIREEEVVPEQFASSSLDSWRAKARAAAFEKLCKRCDPGAEFSVSCSIREEWRSALPTPASADAVIGKFVSQRAKPTLVLVVICELTYKIEE